MSNPRQPLQKPAAEPQSDARGPAEADAEADIASLRVCVDAIDQKLLRLLNERSHYANVIGRIKKSVGLPVYVPSREAEVLQNVISANGGPLENDAVQRLFERIIDETRALERQRYQDDNMR